MTDRDLKRLLSELSKLSLKSLKAGKKYFLIFHDDFLLLSFMRNTWGFFSSFLYVIQKMIYLALSWNSQRSDNCRKECNGPPAVYSWMAVTYCRTEKGDHHQNNVGQKKVLKKKQRCCWYWKNSHIMKLAHPLIWLVSKRNVQVLIKNPT